MLLLLTLAWAFLAGISGKNILATVLEKGGTAYASTIVIIIIIIIIIFGAWFGQTLVKTGIAESIIRGAIELAGDRPTVVTMVVTIVTGLLFISLYGVGAAIALGVIALPIMMSMGGPPQVAATSYVMAIGALAPGGGYIFAPCHNLQPDVPPENIMAIYRAAAEYGVYPLRLPSPPSQGSRSEASK